MRMFWIRFGILCLLAAGLSGCSPRLTNTDCARLPAQPTTLTGADSFTYAATGTRDLRIHVFRPVGGDRARPAILLFFGGGWRTGSIASMTPQARAFAARGYVAVLADYRVKCRDGTTPEASVADGRRAWTWLRGHARELGVDADRIVLGGASSGGQIALVTAMTAAEADRPAALILFNPVVDMAAEAPPWRGAAMRAISPAVLPTDGLPPTLVLHGDEDRRAPIATVRTFCERARAARRRCTVREYPGEAHSFYNRRRAGPGEATSPYDDTLARSLAFSDSVTGPLATGRNP